VTGGEGGPDKADEGGEAEGQISPSLIKRGRSADLEGGEQVLGKKVKIGGMSLLPFSA
jgi:hypothetical protein